MTGDQRSSVAALTERFAFLDELRDSGITNMFAAGPYLASEFGLAKAETHHVLQMWMDTFDSKSSAADRALNALMPPITSIE